MDQALQKKADRRFAVWFWILLLYVIAALVWWFISLERQNREMSTLRTNQLVKDQPGYEQRITAIQEQQERNTTKYISEGITFLLLILIGALIVYRAIRKQVEYVSLQRNFMMAVTHELKTPIATTRLSLETLLYRSVEEARQKKLLQNALTETNRLNRLTNNILLAAQMEEKNYRPVRETVSLSDLVAAVVNDYRRRYPERILEAQISKDQVIQGDALLLEMAISNLIDNAFKYTPGDKPVSVELSNDSACIVLKVADHGTGVPLPERKRIFEKFYRGGDENTRKTKGTGLGLYLTKKIAALHNASVFVQDHYPEGSIFVVQF
jgi:signal transduction histidine kinase